MLLETKHTLVIRITGPTSFLQITERLSVIKIFRKIRYQLMEKNKSARYLKYAIGEIILVVVGILIALQINNWNENNKIRVYELTMLQEIRDALETDTENLSGRISYLKRILNSFNSLALKKNNPSNSADSLLPHLRNVAAYGIVFNINSSPYEAIKSGGLDKISNAPIRNELSNLYGFEIPQAASWINEVLRVELFKRNELFQNLFTVKAVLRNGRIQRDIELNDPSIIYNNQEFENLLLTSWPLPATINHLETILVKMTELKDKINIELNE